MICVLAFILLAVVLADNALAQATTSRFVSTATNTTPINVGPV